MVKPNIVILTSFILFVIPFSGLAQETDRNREERERQQNLNRELTLEREYDPIVQDATKVTSLPAIRELNITKRPTTYSDYALPMLPDKEMNLLPPGKMKADILRTKRNGYLHFGGGMLFNLMGDVGYHILNTERDLLSLYFSHRSTNGNIKYAEEEWLGTRKAMFNDNLGGLDFRHHFNTATLDLGGKFGYSAFNYYGIPTNRSYNSPLMSHIVPEYEDTTTYQGNRLINAYGRLTSTFPFSLGYHIGAEYTNFNQKYLLSKEQQGMTENHIAIDFGLKSPVKNGQTFGADVKANILNYTAPDSVTSVIDEYMKSSIYVDSAAYKTHLNVTLNPYFRMETDTWKLLLGINLMMVSQNDEPNFYASPNIALDVPFTTRSVFYAKLGGGIESNSMAELSRTNRYLNPVFTADASKTWADLKLGVRSSATAGFWFDVFAGYKYTESDVFFNPSSYSWIQEGFNNVSMVYQPTSQRIQAGLSLRYDYQKIVDFYVRGVYDYYMLKHADTWKNSYAVSGLDENSELKAYGKPALTVNAGVNVRPIDPLTFSLDYCLMSGLYAGMPERVWSSGSNLAQAINVKMKDIHDLRFRASWKFNDTFSLYAQFNNLLFQKHALYYGYNLQPFTAMAGFNINF